MTLNPLRFSEQVLGDFLRYQVTAFPLADERLSGQLRAHLALGQARRSAARRRTRSSGWKTNPACASTSMG